MNAATVFCLVVPKIDTNFFAKISEASEGTEVHLTVGEALGAGQFVGLAAVGFDLGGDAFSLHQLENLAGFGRTLEKEEKRADLHVVPGAVVVRPITFLFSQFAGLEPGEIVGEPLSGGSVGFFGDGTLGGKQLDGCHETIKAEPFDDSEATSVDFPGDALSVF